MNVTIRKAIVLVLLAAAQCGVHAADVADLTFTPPEGEPAPRQLVRDCVVNIVGIADARNNRETIGRFARGGSVRAGDALPWLGASLERLAAYGYAVERSAAPRAGAVNIDVRLTRAYTFYWWPQMGGTVALEVALPGTAAPLKLRQMGFRGAGNWDGAQQHVKALNLGADRVIETLAAALKPACGALPAP